MRELLQGAWKLLASRKVSAVLMTLLVGAYVAWLLPFQFYGTPAWRTRNIASETGFVVLGVALLANSVACVLDRTPALVRSALRARSVRAGEPYDAEAEAIRSPLDAGEALKRAARTLRGRAHRVWLSDDGGSAIATIGIWAPLATVAFHLALAFFAVALLLNLNGFFRGKVVAVEGESFDASSPYSYFEPTVEEMEAIPQDVLPKGFVMLEKVEPELWRDVLLFTRLEALVSVDGKRERIAINNSASIDGDQLAVDGFGYSPEFRLVHPDGRVDRAFVRLKVFPPGTEDQFPLEGTGFVVSAALFPDAEVDGTQVTNLSYNLRDPAFGVRIEREGEEDARPVFSGVLRPGEAAGFEGYVFSFPSVRYFAELRVVSNPGAPWFMAGLATALGAALLRFTFRRRRVLVWVQPREGGGSSVRVIARAELWTEAYRCSMLARVRAAVEGEPEEGGDADAAS